MESEFKLGDIVNAYGRWDGVIVRLPIVDGGAHLVCNRQMTQFGDSKYIYEKDLTLINREERKQDEN